MAYKVYHEHTYFFHEYATCILGTFWYILFYIKFPKEVAMANTYSIIQELLHQKVAYQVRLNLIPYDGSPEIMDREGENIFMSISVWISV